MRRYIGRMQDSFNALRKCSKPTIALIEGHCIGGGVDLVTAFDLRYAVKNATFSVKEIDLGIVADIGTLQRLPLLVGEAKTRELALTGRNFDGNEAFKLGLLNECFETQEELEKAVHKLADEISKKVTPHSERCKKVLNFNQDRLIQEGLDYVANWNAASLFSDDLEEAFKAASEKRPPQFRD